MNSCLCRNDIWIITLTFFRHPVLSVVLDLNEAISIKETNNS